MRGSAGGFRTATAQGLSQSGLAAVV